MLLYTLSISESLFLNMTIENVQLISTNSYME
jgi:hypothetical protein